VKQRSLGDSGLQVSLVGVGCNNFAERLDLEASRAVVDKAIELGATFFDTADVYGKLGGSEDYLGRILGERRRQVVLCTKFGVSMTPGVTAKDTSRRYIMTAVEASLRRLRTDYIDVYMLHRPDAVTPIEETLRALEDLIGQGKVRTIGCSNLPAWQVVEAHWTSVHHGLHRFVCAQDEYSLLARSPERELIPALERCGAGLLPYFPLASGLLSGKYRRDAPLPAGSRIGDFRQYQDRHLSEANWAIVERLRDFAAQRGHTLLELAFSWLASRPCVSSIIAGASTPGQLEQNVNAANWVLTPDDQAEIDRITSTAGAAGR
jgi:aryl-alcohol dehydrogenase-like predicted oxidoreductase